MAGLHVVRSACKPFILISAASQFPMTSIIQKLQTSKPTVKILQDVFTRLKLPTSKKAKTYNIPSCATLYWDLLLSLNPVEMHRTWHMQEYLFPACIRSNPKKRTRQTCSRFDQTQMSRNVSNLRSGKGKGRNDKWKASTRTF